MPRHVAALHAALACASSPSPCSPAACSSIWNRIASHLTEDGRIDAQVSQQLLSQLSMLVRACALALGVVAVTPWLWSALRRRAQVVAVLWSWCTAASIFAATFIIASPYSLRKAAFVKGLFVEASDAAAPLSAAWLSTWFRGVATAVEWPVLVAALAAMTALVWTARRHRALVDPAQPILVAWIALYSLVLLAPVHEFYVHYALPLAPPAVMLAASGGVAAAGWLGGVFERRALAITALCAVVAAVVIPFGAQLVTTRTQLQNRERTSDAVFVGKWLECRVPSSARIAYDYFSYVPPVFQDAMPTWGGSREWLSRFDPDVVIVYGVTAGAVMEEADHAEYYPVSRGEPLRLRARAVARRVHRMYGRSGQAGAMSRRPPAPTADCQTQRRSATRARPMRTSRGTSPAATRSAVHPPSAGARRPGTRGRSRIADSSMALRRTVQAPLNRQAQERSGAERETGLEDDGVGAPRCERLSKRDAVTRDRQVVSRIEKEPHPTDGRARRANGPDSCR